MKILLLNPPTLDNRAFIREGRCMQEGGVWTTLWPPVTLATAAALLEGGGHDVTLRDCAANGMTRQALLDFFDAGSFDIVAWGAATPSIGSDLALAGELRGLRPQVRTAVLGTHCSHFAGECLDAAPDLDYIISREPEETLAELAAILEGGGEPGGIEGLSFRDCEGRIVHTPPRAFVANLDALPFPAWHLVDRSRYRLPLSGEGFLIIAPSRGCPYSCTFCTSQAYYGKKLRKKSVPRVIAEIEHARDHFGTRQFFIWADTFTADKDYVRRFCAALGERGLKIGWTCNSRVDTVDADMLRQMRKAGCWMISFGIESGDQELLDSMGKRITVEKARDAARWAKEAGMVVAGHFVLGLPGETVETLEKTIAFSLELDIDIGQFYSAAPFPGSELFDTAIKQGWIDGGAFDEFSQNSSVMKLPGLEPAVVDKYRMIAYKRFYFRPRPHLRMLRLVRPRGLWNALWGAARFMRWAGTSHGE